ncbi:PilZ domain-containing protein [Tissierella sp. Yu-01]|uniref:flagellar brake protein n=1 Tax=Tissierella sp. Yu-01 TaxID=3035694 RepID=UPI00240DA45C|nr:PilZ domain-containing protein [Tissierella sp. Yu-01]WFA07880.1 PilZ domain-containing protein [Tissierella sp. Yu-01]
MNLFVLNSKIELIDDNDESTYGLIHDYVDDKLYISTTPDDKEFKILRIGDMVRGIFFSGAIGKSFDAIVSNRISGEIIIYELTNINNVTTIQRRQDVRVSCSIPIYFTDREFFINEDRKHLINQIEDIKLNSTEGIIADLSGGGIKLVTSKKFNPDEILVFLFYLKDKPIIVKGQLLHKAINIVKKTPLYNYGVKFLDITEAEREEIIRFLFILMRKNRLR